MDHAVSKAAPIQAHVVLKRTEGSPSARIQPPSPEARDDARRELEDLGFTIVRVSPLSILIEGLPEKFEDVFHAHAQQQDSDVKKHWPQTYLAWTKEPEIPSALQKTVQHIVLPEPVELH